MICAAAIDQSIYKSHKNLQRCIRLHFQIYPHTRNNLKSVWFNVSPPLLRRDEKLFATIVWFGVRHLRTYGNELINGLIYQLYNTDMASEDDIPRIE